jgi:hypothetical protein
MGSGFFIFLSKGAYLVVRLFGAPYLARTQDAGRRNKRAMKLVDQAGIVFISFVILFLSGCDGLPLADNRARPEPPALPAEVVPCDPFVNLSAMKMNVVYVGVPNPLDLQTIGMDLNEIMLVASPPGYLTQYGKEYSLNVGTPGVQMVKVLHKGKLLNSFSFRAKRIPTPLAKLGKSLSGKIRAGEFKAQRGLIASLEDFDFNVKCKITGFRVTRNSLAEGRLTETNSDSSFEGKSNLLIQKAEPNDIYTFTNVHAKCPGDNVRRTINSLVFEIV